MSAGVFNNVTSSSNNITLPGGGISNNFALSTNHAVMLYNDGSRWIVFTYY